jgi:uncharacterized protein
MDRHALPLGGVHGVAHWARVLENGRRLALSTGADLGVVELFSYFHDSCRLSDWRDLSHGPRAAELVRGLRAEIELEDDRFALLVEACDCHTRGPRPGADTTVLTCVDADRLDIPRVGMNVRPELLFTPAARDNGMILWASRRATRRDVPGLCAAEWGWRG